MTGEMSREEVTPDAYPFHFGAAHDIVRGRRKMQVQLMVRRGIPVCKTVATYQEASEAVRKFIGNRGASQCPRGMGLIAENGNANAAHVSFNGRVWAGTPQEWESGMAPLYDPFDPQGR